MKTFLLIMIVLFAMAVIAFIYLGHHSRSAPALTLVNAKLPQCSSKPNCVSSQQVAGDAHFIKAFEMHQTKAKDAMKILVKILDEMGGLVLEQDQQFLVTQFSSSIFGFVDDVAFSFDEQSRLIHLYSASRVGYSDRGVNRARLEAIRARYQLLSEI